MNYNKIIIKIVFNQDSYGRELRKYVQSGPKELLVGNCILRIKHK